MSDNELIRLNKYMSDSGYCSRREADRLIESGKVLVDGWPAVMGQKVCPGQRIECGGQVLRQKEKTILIAYNKPEGVECTTARDNPDNIIDRIGYPERIYPVGRLDKNSTGLILLTNDGSLVNSVLKSANEHEKEYEVQVNRPVTAAFLEKMSEGVDISGVDGRGNKLTGTLRTETMGTKRNDYADGENGTGGRNLSEKEKYYSITRPCRVIRTGKYSFNIILTQGLNRQIRRMCQALGYKVIALKRVRIMNIELGDLAPDSWRDVNPEVLMRKDPQDP